MFDWISHPSAWFSLITLSVLEVVLGVDNIVFIAILASKLPHEQRDRARRLGLSVALVSRIILLCSVNWLKNLTKPAFVLPFAQVGAEIREITWKDLILVVGGVFLIVKSAKEIHHKIKGYSDGEREVNAPSLRSVLIQIFLLDVVFSLDTVITAVGMSDELMIMILAIIVAVGFMMFYSGYIAKFIEENPTIKMLALAFLVLIGGNLTIEGLGFHLEKAFTYFAMAFSAVVEILNLRMRRQMTA